MDSHASTSTSTVSSSSSSFSSASASSKSLHHLKHSSSSVIPDSTPNTQTFQLSPILLVSTLDGQLHALDRQTGIWNWTLNDPNHASNGLLDRCGLVDSPCLSSDQPHSDQDHELYAIEPQNDGDLYVFVKSSSQPSRLEKLPLSVSQLVNLSPFTFPGDSSKMFIGKKESHLIAIDLKTGSVVNSLNSKPKQGSLKGKEKSSRYHQCHSQRSFDFLTSQEFDRDGACPVKPETSNPSIDQDENCEPIDHRPGDLLYIGRTDYQVSIYSKPNTLIQSLRYSTYTPSNLPHSLQNMWTRTPDELYLEPTHDGNLVCFQVASQAASTPPSRSEHTTIKWQNSFDHPVTSVFDVVFPSAHDEPGTSTNRTSRDPGPSEVLEDSTDSASKPTTLQQPIIFVQPKFLPHKDDQSHSKFPPDDDQFNLFKHLHSQSSFSTPFQPIHPTGQRSAFVGKYQESFYVMSQQNYPLAVFAPSAYQTLGHEPSIGTHHLLNSQAMNGFLDFSYTNRLLDPPTSENLHTSSNLPLGLDPPPNPLTLPPSKKVDNSKLQQNSGLSGVPVPSTHTNFLSDTEELPHQSPMQLHQRAAQISSLLVRTFKQQLMPSEGGSALSNGRSDERFPDLNPLLTIFLVLVIMSWWASRKVGSPSSARWDHLHRLVNQALGSNDSSKVEKGPNLKTVGTVESRDGTVTAEVPITIPIKESECPTIVHGSPDKPLSNGSNDDDSLPTSKQKLKRRRGKRPGQKAAAAAAKAEAEAAKALTSVTLSDSASSQPGPMEAPPIVSKPLSLAEPRTPQKTKPNHKKSKPSSTSGVGISQPSDQVASTAASVIHPISNENIPNPAAILFKLNDEDRHKDKPINSIVEFSVNGYSGSEPQRVGSLVVTNETIGYGSHGTVVLKGTFQGRQVAVKRLLKDFVTLASHEVSLLQESDDHPNVVRYFVKESLDNFLYIALELCSASLFDLVEKRQFKEYEELDQIFNAKKALKQISSGLRYLHKLKIVHRDIKPQNILISLTRSPPASSKITSKRSGVGLAGKNFRMLISDFGLCKKLELDESSFAQTANHAAGSFGYRAPEILKGQVNLNEQSNSTASSSMINCTVQNAAAGTNGGSHGSSSTSNPETSHHRLTRSIDIFSLGCIYYYVLTKGDHPFGSRYEREMNILKDEICLEQLDGLDEEAFEAQQLIRSMIKSNPKERPTAEEVLQNPYFWEPTKRLNFLCDCSDRFEIMERDPPEKALIQLEDQEQFYKYVHHKSPSVNPLVQKQNIRSKGLDWSKIIDRGLVDNLGRYRKYDGASIRDLLRVMRNKKHHFQDLPDGIKKLLGDMPEGFLNYFSRKFPSLLVHVYSIILESNLKTENLFATYFDVDEI